MVTSGAPTTAGSSSTSLPCYEIGTGTHAATIRSIVWAPHDPNVLFTAAEDGALRTWDLRAKDAVASHSFSGTLGSCEINTVTTASATGGTTSRSVLTLAAGKTVSVFDLAGRLPSASVQSLNLNVDVASAACHAGKVVVGAASDTWVRVYDLSTGEELETRKGHHGPVWSAAFSPDGMLYATGSEDGTVKLWKYGAGPYGLWL